VTNNVGCFIRNKSLVISVFLDMIWSRETRR